MALPDSCVIGGTVAAWVKIENCDHLDGILTTSDVATLGFQIRCESDLVRYLCSI